MEPWYAIYPAVTAVTFAGLAVGVYRKRAALGDSYLEWMAAMLLCAAGFVGPLVAAGLFFNDGGDLAVAAMGAGALLGLIAAFSGLLQRYTRGRWGTPPVRLALFGAGLALSSLGFGAALGGASGVGDGIPGSWVFIPVTAAVAALFPVVLLCAQRGAARAGTASILQLCLGGGLIAAGLATTALGDLLIGPGMGMAGGGVMYSGVSVTVSKAPAARTPIVAPKVESEEPARPTATAGRKVRVPKGAAMRVTSFRDDGPGNTK